MKKLSVAILGTGASAAFTYAACRDYGCKSVVYGSKVISIPQGAFWFHQAPAYAIAHADAKSVPINMTTIGSRVGYVEKQWGKGANPDLSSFPTYDYNEQGYDPAKIWDSMWLGAVFKQTPMLTDSDIISLASEYDIVFMTFLSQKALETASSSFIRIKTASFSLTGNPMLAVFQLMNPNFKFVDQVIYDGRPASKIVRASYLFGKVHLEFVQDASVETVFDGETAKNVQPGMFMDIKPGSPENTIRLASNVHNIGRYATMRRHALASDSYKEAMDVLTSS